MPDGTTRIGHVDVEGIWQQWGVPLAWRLVKGEDLICHT